MGAPLEGADVLSPAASFKPERWKVTPPTVTRHFRPSLAYRMALVGEGRFDAMVTLRDAWEWDIAAGALIASEAGASVVDRTGTPLAFNSPERMTPGVIVAPERLAGTVVTGLI